MPALTPLPLPPDLWQALCAFLQAHATCQVIIHQQNGHVWAVDLGLAKVRVRAGDVVASEHPCRVSSSSHGP